MTDIEQSVRQTMFEVRKAAQLNAADLAILFAQMPQVQNLTGPDALTIFAQTLKESAQ